MAYMKDVRGRRLDRIGVPDTRKGLYVPAGWGEFIRPKLAQAKAGTGKATIAYMGDSIGGYYTSDLHTKTVPARIQAKLMALGFPDGGGGYSTVGNTKVHLGSLNAAYDSLFIQTTGTWASSNVSDGPANRGLQSLTDGSTITETVRGTKVGVVYLTQGSGGGQLQVTIDGVAGAPFATSPGGPGFARYEVTGLAPGSHTVVVTKVGTTRADVWGFYGENDTGILVNNFCSYGSTTGNDAVTSAVFGQAAAWSGGYQYRSDLFIYAKGANDANGAATDPEVFADNIAKVLDQVRSAGTADGATDIILFLPHLGNFDANRLGRDYAIRLRGIADHYCAALVNAAPIYRNSKSYGNSVGLFGVTSGASPGAVGTDSVHISDSGADQYADILMQVIESAL